MLQLLNVIVMQLGPEGIDICSMINQHVCCGLVTMTEGDMQACFDQVVFAMIPLDSHIRVYQLPGDHLENCIMIIPVAGFFKSFVSAWTF